MSRSLFLTALISAVMSATVTSAMARLSSPPATQAAPLEQMAVPLLQAQRVEIVDARGTVRGSLGMAAHPLGAMEEARDVILEMRDEDGQPRVQLALQSDRPGVMFPGLTMSSPTGVQAALGSDPAGNVHLTLFRPGGERALLSVGTGGPPMLEMVGADGRVIWQAP